MTSSIESAPQPSDLHATISASAEYAYNEVAETTGISAAAMHRKRLCHMVARQMVEHLVTTGLTAATDTRGGWTVDSHTYGVIQHNDPETGEVEVIADPTWQQFLKPEQITPDTPKTLIGSRAKIMAILGEQYGLDAATQALWAPKPPAKH